MERLFTFLLSGQLVVSHLTVMMLALLCGTVAIQCLSAGRIRRDIRVALFGVSITVADLVTFFETLWSSYPYLKGQIPWPATAVAALVTLITASVSAWLYLWPRRSIKTVILAGCALALGVSFSAFTILVSIVKPFVLAYDLSAVLSVMVLGSTLCGFAFWELGSVAATRPRLSASVLLALTLGVLPLGSMGSVLPFAEWMSVIRTPDSASFSPISVIVLSEFIAIVFLVCIASLLDIRVAIAQQREGDRIRHLADGTFEGLLICRGSEIIDANERIQEMTGLDLATLRHRDMLSLFVTPPSGQALCGGTTSPSGSFAPEQRDLLGPGQRRIPVEILSREMPYVDGRGAIVLAVRDITERKAAEEHIRYLALHDSLTSLPNRRGLEIVLTQVIESSRKAGCESAILGLDLDGFKAVNDTLGHHAGDILLREVAARFQGQLRDADYLARLGGDEFIIILRTIGSKNDPVQLAKRLIACLWKPFRLSGHDAYVGVSIGVAVCPRDGDNAQMLLKCADIAMYQAKLNGKGQVCEFAAGMDVDLRERHDLEVDLRRALTRNELTIHYQPLFDSAGKITAFEALARWPHPTRGMIPPDRFIPLAEETGLIIPLGEWVLRTACTVAAAWRPDISIAVNLSPI